MAALTRLRRILYAALAALLPLLLIAAIEILLRLAGAGGDPPLFRKVGATDRGTLFVTERARAASYFVVAPERMSPMEQNTFLMPKPTNGLRIVVVGESAARGYPQPMAFAASSFLRELLAECRPDRAVEVLNLSCTAVASFPVMDIGLQALRCQPDALVVYAGNNEFYGTYGVASSRRLGTTPAALQWQHRLRGLALVQLPARWTRKTPAAGDARTLIEAMAGQPYLAADDPLRSAAARNLQRHLARLCAAYRARGIPAIVCTSPSNERDLAPIGEDPAPAPPDGSDAAALSDFVALHPRHARAHYLLGQAALARGDDDEARRLLLRARDLDPMPWRATTDMIEATREAARAEGAVVCDLVGAFRAASPHGLVGWELMDDHVHPTLEGQLLVARQLLESLTRVEGPARLAPADLQRAPDDAALLRAAGDNIYDRFSVAHAMRILFEVPFFKKSNPAAAERFRVLTQGYADRMPAFVGPTIAEWRKIPALSIGRRPLSGMLAAPFLQQGRPQDAAALLRAARRSVPLFSSWDLEYAYFDLACRREAKGHLDAADIVEARDALWRASVLRQYGLAGTGQAERFAGRIHQLMGEHREAIPLLEAARAKLRDPERLACEQALMTSLLEVREFDAARGLASEGAARGGAYGAVYRAFLADIEAAAARAP